ncbi:MAG TPA: hypothetical protein PKD63_01040 [Solirubrobacteraceae bacterium]|nr:hypothetical protein [Solirubrobacteraceae bacterium]
MSPEAPPAANTSLSVVCMVHEHGPQVAAMLRMLRAAAGEIVVAADARMDPADLGDLAAVADRLVRHEFRSPARALPWLHGLARGEWILLIGSDEVPSAALLAALPHLVRADDVQEYRMPVRWLFPDTGHWLDERPWAPDFHNRLVRNAATLAFAGLNHTEATPVLPARYIEAPLYHLDCAVTTRAARERKIARYTADRPGLRAPGGGDLNEVYYLPERHARLPGRPVPDADRELIAAVTGARPTGHPPPPPGTIPLASAAEVDRPWPGRDFGPGAYAARIEPLERDARTLPGETRPLAVRLTNAGDELWHAGSHGARPVHLSYRLAEPGGRGLVEEGLRTPLPAPVPPGTTCVVPVHVLAPERPGSYEVRFDVVHETVRWFGVDARATIVVDAAARA